MRRVARLEALLRVRMASLVIGHFQRVRVRHVVTVLSRRAEHKTATVAGRPVMVSGVDRRAMAGATITETVHLAAMHFAPMRRVAIVVDRRNGVRPLVGISSVLSGRTIAV